MTKVWKRFVHTLLFAASLTASAPAISAEPPHPPELVHADTPLWRPYEDGDVWPTQFSNDRGMGCAYPVKLGDWRLTESAQPDAVQYFQLTGEGFIHCWLLASRGVDHRQRVEAAPEIQFEKPKLGFLIKIGRATGRDLWLLQLGARPGSDYILLARQPTTKLVDRFDVLQRICPKGRRRGGFGLDIAATDYCSINTRTAMVAFAKSMARLPNYGVLTFEGPVPAKGESSK